MAYDDDNDQSEHNYLGGGTDGCTNMQRDERNVAEISKNPASHIGETRIQTFVERKGNGSRG